MATEQATPAPRSGAPRPARPLRVCMVHYSHFEVDSRVQRQARTLAERGDEIDAICLSQPDEMRVGDGRIRVHPVATEKRRDGTLGYLRGYSRFFAGALARVTALDRKRRFDVVEIHNMPDFLTFTAIVPKLRGTPVLLDVHDTFPELFATKFEMPMDGAGIRLIKHEEYVSATIADAMLAVTEEAGERLASRGVGRGKLHVVMNSPDERVFGPARPPVDIPAEGEIRAVYHGGVAPRFGVETLVRACHLLRERLPRLRACVYGSDAEESRPVAQLARDLCEGMVDVAERPTPFNQIPEKLSASHIGVVPTLQDGFTELLLPVKLMEYVHMGIPVVSSRLPVIERYFGEDEVRFFEPGSAQSLADALAEVAADPAAAHERAVNATRRLEEFAWPRQRETYLTVIDRLTGRRNGNGA